MPPSFLLPTSRVCIPDYFELPTADCAECASEAWTAVGVTCGVLFVVLGLIYSFLRCVYKRLPKRTRRRLSGTGKILFVFIQVGASLPGILRFDPRRYSSFTDFW